MPLRPVGGRRHPARPVPILSVMKPLESSSRSATASTGVAVGQRVVLFLPRCGQCGVRDRRSSEPGSAANKAGHTARWRYPAQPGRPPGVPPPGVLPLIHVVVNRASVVPVPHEVLTVAALLRVRGAHRWGTNVGDPQPGQSKPSMARGVGMAAVLTALTYSW